MSEDIGCYIRDGVFYAEPSESFEEGMTVGPLEDGKWLISVAEEKAVDSYNNSFTCDMTMTRAQMLALAAFLNGALAASPDAD